MLRSVLAVGVLGVCTWLVACVGPTDVASSSSGVGVQSDAGSAQGSAWAPVRKTEERVAVLASKYPDFAGYYCRDGDLVVAIATSVNSVEAQALAADVLASSTPRFCRTRETLTHTPTVVLEQRTYSFLKMAEWRDRLSPRLFDVGATSVGIRYKDNNVRIRVRAGSLSTVNAAVAAQGIPDSAIDAQEAPIARPTSCATPSPSFGEIGPHYLSKCFRPALGGSQIYMYNYDFTQIGGCTITLAASRAGNRGFITASHCVPPELNNAGDWAEQPGPMDTSQLIAEESVDPLGWQCGASTCKYSDSAWMAQTAVNLGQKGAIVQPISDQGLVDYNDGVHHGSCFLQGQPCTANTAHPRFAIWADEYPMENMQVEKVGANSGWTTGYIESTCEEISDDMGHIMYCNGAATTDAGPGDSGAPLFYWTLDPQDTVYLIGITWGTPDNASLVYSPWTNVQEDLGAQDIEYESQFEVLAATPGVKAISGDFNGDHKTDIALVGGPSWTEIPIAFSNGDGTFVMERVSTTFADFASSAGAQVVAADLNNDGFTDLVAAGGSGWNTIPIAFSNGFGFGTHSFTVTNFSNWTLAAQIQVAGAKLLSGDVNGDHRQDIIIVGGSGSTGIWSGISGGDGTFVELFSSSPTFASWASIAGVTAVSGDLDNNGIVDIALTGGPGWTTIPVAFRAFDGSYVVTNDVVSNFPGWARTSGAHLTIGDVNADLRADLILSGGTGWATVPVARSNGDGTFSVTNNPAAAFATAAQGLPSISGDFDNNGHADVSALGVAAWWTIPIALTGSDGSYTYSNATGP